MAILNFCVKRKSTLILETVRNRPISMKFLTHRVPVECTGDIPQTWLFRHFWWPSWIFTQYTKVHLSWKWCEIEWFWQNFWATGYLQSVVASFLKNHFPTTSGSHLEFLRKMLKCIYLGNSERWSDFDEVSDLQLSAESNGDFSQKSLSHYFWRRSWIFA